MNSSTSESQKLRKGEACMYCRRRKMKCDGVRPVCGQCVRGDRPEDCEYASNSGYSRTKGLEDAIARMEARIRELEDPQPVPASSLLLYDPYSSTGGHRLAADDDLPTFQGPSHDPTPPSESWWTSEEPTQSMRESLINVFFQSATDFGFFLNKSRFRESALRGLPLGHPTRPLPALIVMVYLAGVHISKDPVHNIHEEAILTRVLHLLSGALSGDHPLKIMHTIQTEVLLAQYLFSSGRLLEAKYHLSIVVGLAFAARLNKIRSGEIADPSPLAAPADSIEEGERILAYWTVDAMDKYWAVAFNSPPNAPCSTETPSQQCDTPWPLEMEEYERHGLPPHYRSNFTVQNFLNDVPNSGTSALAFLAKAAILWEWSNRLVNQLQSDPSGQAATSHTNSFTRLDYLIMQLIAAMCEQDQIDTILSRCIANAATIRLHSGFSDASVISRNKCLGAAEAVVLALNSIQNLDSAYMNPIIASVWTATAQVIKKEVNTWRSLSSNAGQQEAERAERDLKRIFDVGLNVMTVLAERSQLIRYQVELTQQAYTALFGV